VRFSGRSRHHSAEPSTDIEAAREAALKMLERTRRTRQDLARRLSEKGFAASAIDHVLERLASAGLVDDAEFARAFLAGRWGRRSAGWRRLERELRSRGISVDDIERGRAMLEAEVGTIDELSSARRLIAQAARRYQTLRPELRRRRLYALLVRRGFDGETIEQALRGDPESD